MEETCLTQRIGQVEERVAAMLQQQTKLKIQNQQIKAKIAKIEKMVGGREEGKQEEYLDKTIANHELTLSKYQQLYARIKQNSGKGMMASGKDICESGQWASGCDSVRVVKQVLCEGCGLSFKPNRYYQHLPNCIPSSNPPRLTASMLIS